MNPPSKGRVIFFPMKFIQTDEILKKLEFYQEQFNLYHAQIQLDSRNMSAGEKWLFKENSHNRVRDNWKLLDGGECKSPNVQKTSMES
jgi:hypothetical protein